jgi:hypothetical protein
MEFPGNRPIPVADSRQIAIVDSFMYLLGHSSVLGTISRLHGYWADKAGANWDGVAGHNAVELAQMFHIEIDSAKTGDFQQIPYRLSTVAAPDYDPHHQHKSRKSCSTLGALCAESANTQRWFSSISISDDRKVRFDQELGDFLIPAVVLREVRARHTKLTGNMQSAITKNKLRQEEARKHQSEHVGGGGGSSRHSSRIGGGDGGGSGASGSSTVAQGKEADEAFRRQMDEFVADEQHFFDNLDSDDRKDQTAAAWYRLVVQALQRRQMAVNAAVEKAGAIGGAGSIGAGSSSADALKQPRLPHWLHVICGPHLYKLKTSEHCKRTGKTSITYLSGY